MGDNDINAIDKLLGRCHGHLPAVVMWNDDQESFVFKGKEDEIISRITSMEDAVERVLAPYIPESLRGDKFGVECTPYDNEWIRQWTDDIDCPFGALESDANLISSIRGTDFASESSESSSTSQELHVVPRKLQVRLTGVTIITGEWVPMDINDLIVLQGQISPISASVYGFIGTTATMHTDQVTGDAVRFDTNADDEVKTLFVCLFVSVNSIDSFTCCLLISGSGG